ncbi:type II toxin-antitoxin system YoeB family toxin [Gordonia polyisoprenivorans]|uniref:type II toxin-antitoxin system YoeB family toxin n=1 Tax=Gordonia polyisoprenivorans TaxID=84595 RepID=UPI001FCC7852|nr:type II toxin-antitoxin system YoeB family toxin [Gordonia polyisoprenivorans]
MHWQTADRRLLKRINTLLDACLRDEFTPWPRRAATAPTTNRGPVSRPACPRPSSATTA